MSMLKSLSHDRLTSLLRYEPETGNFYWLTAKRRGRGGALAGCIEKRNGYRVIGIDGKYYYAHRLAWFYTHGEAPADLVDHINGETDDNRLCNLREATPSQNMWNSKRPKNNKVGLKGASYLTAGKCWCSSIRAKGKTYHLGNFATAEEAAAAYQKASLELHGDFARPV